ncbi:MAG: hypothetical protein D6765_15390 [Bacteroidetes bacterium]|nr:MAG: hypothetical protein D6765_15390 [Bacteroidota bacterium]
MGFQMLQKHSLISRKATKTQHLYGKIINEAGLAKGVRPLLGQEGAPIRLPGSFLFVRRIAREI